jgi:hypothetical protein
MVGILAVEASSGRYEFPVEGEGRPAEESFILDI